MRSALLLFFWTFYLCGASAQVFDLSHIDPIPVGGDAEIKQILKKEMVYPESALKMGTKGKVVLHAIINSAGEPERVVILKSTNKLFNQESLRLFSLIRWKPAVNAIGATEGERTLKIRFSPRLYQKNCEARGDRSIYHPYPVDSTARIYSEATVDTKPILDTEESIMGFIQKHLRYPSDAVKHSISGVVEVSFVVETSGRVTNVQVIQPLAYCTAEAKRLVHQMNFRPGVKNRKIVRTEMLCKIRFIL